MVIDMYRVIKHFTDLQDNKQPYNPGDEFPRDGLNVNKKRLNELASNKNRRKEPLIELVEEPESVIADTKDVLAESKDVLTEKED